MDPSVALPVEETPVFTVSRLNARIKELLEATYPFIWVKGEISGLTVPASGHCYFTLKDGQSQIRAVMFRTQKRGLRFTPESGLQVLCFGHVTVYEPRGEYQVIIENMQPEGAGALQLAFEQLKKKLEAEGLFAPERKLPLPFCPQRIGIVTSSTGAAIRDILKIFQRSPYPLSVTLFPVRVQGRESAWEIAAAVECANTHRERLGLDLLIVGRGGGSIEDLWSFNEEIVARAIAASGIPIISAVGHEIDFTISDAVADMRAPTPTAAAEWVVSRLEVLERDLSAYTDRLRQAICNKVCACRQHASFLEKRLVSPVRRLEDLRIFVDDRSARLHLAFEHHLERLRAGCRRLDEKLALVSPLKSIRQHRDHVSRMEKELPVRYHNVLDKKRLGLQKYASQLDSLSPLAVLNRGYSITFRSADGAVVRSSPEVSAGDRVRVRLCRGTLECTVDKTVAEENPASAEKDKE